jgi:cyclic pyranopterin phosphate synthase
MRSLRISVTDRCNLRCSYCMPEPDYEWLPKRELLDYAEIGRLVDRFVELGVDRVRLTGGEPLLRRDLPVLVRDLARRPGLKDVAITTNGMLLADQAEALRDAGLSRVTVSLDTLVPDRFERLTRRRGLDTVLEGIAAARRVGLGHQLKIDCVVIAGVNDDEMGHLIAYGRDVGAEVRFIEYMDVGGATRWSPEQVVSRQEMLERVRAWGGPVERLDGRGAAPAERFALADGTVFGIIASTTAPFCGSCDRSRLTADGTWYHCLYARRGIDLKHHLRRGDDDATLTHLLAERWRSRTDRGAESRLSIADRGAFVPLDALRADPRLEMHTRGG